MGGMAEVAQFEIDIITAKIAERHEYKINRDYDSADAIRDELNERYGIKIDDRTKEWKCVMPANTTHHLKGILRKQTNLLSPRIQKKTWIWMGKWMRFYKRLNHRLMSNNFTFNRRGWYCCCC